MKRTFTASITREGEWYVAECLEVDVASQRVGDARERVWSTATTLARASRPAPRLPRLAEAEEDLMYAPADRWPPR